ncbi:MAG: hypothetical protein Q7U47_00815 [Paludibacter sp.]|nr:hypothetical protein [Paludibacter sp.]
MKSVKLSILVFLMINLSSCRDETSIIMKYHFFTQSELTNLYINQDSALNFQKGVAKCITYDQFNVCQRFYVEIDTILFKSEKGDTIACKYDNGIMINRVLDFFFTPETKTIGGVNLTPIDSCFFSEVFYSIHKPSEFKEDSLAQNIGFYYRGYKDNKYNAYLYRSRLLAQDNTYFISSRDNFTINDLIFENCLFVIFFDMFSIEQASIIYSNKYGFLQVKEKQHEITRMF